MREAIDIAKSLNSNPLELISVAHRYPDEVLANAALPLISLESPELYVEIISTARRTLIKKKSQEAAKKVSSMEWRKATCAAVRKTIAAYYDPWDPVPKYGVVANPITALDIAESFIAGKVPRSALSWGNRYAQSFIDYHLPKNGPEKEKTYLLVTRHLAELCKVCCGLDRMVMWGGITDALDFLLVHKDMECLEEKERILDGLLSTTKKKARTK
jgi:hypothetical protein